MIKKLIIIFFSLLLLVSAVYAQKNDFYASANNINLCSCAFFSDGIAVVNDGVITNGFVLRQSGDAAKFVALEKTSFVLKPGESVFVRQYFRAPCDAKGSFDLTTDVFTDTGLHKVLKQKVSITKCDNIGVSVSDTGKKACLCEPFRYDFTITNPLSFDDAYSFYPSKYGEYALVSNARTVGAGDSQDFVLVFDLPCNFEGSKSFDLVVSTEKTGLMKKVPLFFGIDSSCYAYPSNLTVTEPAEPKEEFDFSVLLDYALVCLAVLPVVILLLLLLAALKIVPEKTPKRIEPVSYEWEKIFKKEEKVFKKTSNVYLAVIVLVMILVVLIGSSVFFVATMPGLNVTKNVTAEIPALNLTINETIAGKGLFDWLNFSKIVSKLTYKPESNVSSNVSFEPRISFPFRNITLPKIGMPEFNVTMPRFNFTLPDFDFSKNKTMNRTGREPVFTKENFSNIFSSVKWFAVTYLYYILAGVVILVVIIFVLSRREKKTRHSRRER